MKRSFKRIALLAIFTGAFMSSCTEDEFLTEEEVGTHHSYLKTENVPTSTESFALDFAKYIQANPSALTTLNEAIHKVVGYDLDENLTFYDILQFNNSVFFGSEDSDIINLGRGISAEKLKDLGYNSTNYYGGLNIYWGYHDEWDGKTLPIIGYVENGKETINIKGYQITEKSIEKTNITIADFDSVKFPVIIINYSDRDYAEYPEFKRGIRQKGGKIWLYDGYNDNNDTNEEDNEISIWNDQSKTYNLQLIAFKAGTQYDILTGSEFVFESGYINSTSSDSEKNIYTCEYTRKEIKLGKTKNFNTSLNPDWIYNHDKVHFHILETDKGWEDNISLSLSIDGIASFSVTLPRLSYDDVIYQGVWYRESYIADLASEYNTNSMHIGDNHLVTRLKVSDRPY
ncbi:MAG: hypothetical protein U0K59_07940 [Bacteroidales bacterium]|nr:hypothetical protein [Bacteroidales bacterium]